MCIRDRFYSVYFIPDELIQDFREKMDGLEEDNILSTEGGGWSLQCEDI